MSGFDPSTALFGETGSSDEASAWWWREGRHQMGPVGKFNVKRRLDGAVIVRLEPSEFVVSPLHAVEMAKALLKEAGVEVVMADAGQTVIRPKNGHVIR